MLLLLCMVALAGDNYRQLGLMIVYINKCIISLSVLEAVVCYCV